MVQRAGYLLIQMVRRLFEDFGNTFRTAVCDVKRPRGVFFLEDLCGFIFEVSRCVELIS